MRNMIRKPITMIGLAVLLGLIGSLAGYAVLAQEPGETERLEGNRGETGRILNVTPEDVEALQPEDMTVLYHFAGAISNDVAAPAKATIVQCTNVDDAVSTGVEVQLFDYDAGDVFTASINVGPLRTVTFESIPVAFTYADVFINADRVDQGYGRIFTEHDNVICTVQTVDPDNNPPTWGFDIPLYTGPGYPTFLPAVENGTAP